jgi:hypothetical protein
MSLFERYLSLGTWISQDEARALYKYLLNQKADIYNQYAKEVLENKALSAYIANAEILYSLSGGRVTCEVRELGTSEFSPIIRECFLTTGFNRNQSKLIKFFAQCDVDSLMNFPIDPKEKSAENGINLISFPFYDLNYYSDGKGKLLGFLKKLRTNDSEMLEKLSN